MKSFSEWIKENSDIAKVKAAPVTKCPKCNADVYHYQNIGSSSVSNFWRCNCGNVFQHNPPHPGWEDDSV
jgi:DNA-directed RNA polymerase subunit M/transcription elongation factor TFIIS